VIRQSHSRCNTQATVVTATVENSQPKVPLSGDGTTTISMNNQLPQIASHPRR